MTDQLVYSRAELLSDHDIADPLVVGGVRCHGGFLSDGTYVSPRTGARTQAIAAWTRTHAVNLRHRPRVNFSPVIITNVIIQADSFP